MDLARYVVDAVVLEGRGVREVARAHGVSKSWVSVQLARYREGGYEALVPRSRRAHTRPNRTPAEVEDEIVLLRKHLADEGFDAGPRTIHWHLSKRRADVPSVSTIWRILGRRGFIEETPQKRPHASLIRFEAALPNECWQADVTHWHLKNKADVEILDFIDDHSRLIVAARVVAASTKVHDVVETFHAAGTTWGYPASVLTDIQDDYALGSTVCPAGGGKLQGDRCPLRIAADRSERLTTPCLLGVSRAGATPGKEASC